VAPILLIFLRINEHLGRLLVGPNALWPTQPKFWVDHDDPPGPRYIAPPMPANTTDGILNMKRIPSLALSNVHSVPDSLSSVAVTCGESVDEDEGWEQFSGLWSHRYRSTSEWQTHRDPEYIQILKTIHTYCT